MKKILVLFFFLILSGQLLAGTYGDMSAEEWAETEKEAEENIYKTDNTLESIAGILSSPINSDGCCSWMDVTATTSKIKGYNDSKNEVNIRGLGKAYVNFDGSSAGLSGVTIKFKKSQVTEEEIIGTPTSQFDPESEITSIMTCDNGDSIYSKDVFKLVLPGRKPISFKIDSDDEFVKFVFSPNELLTCDQEQEVISDPTSSVYISGGI